MPDTIPMTRRDKAGDAFTVRAFGEPDLAALQGFYEDFAPKRVAQGLPPEGTQRIHRWLGLVLANGTHLLAERGAALIGHCMLIPTRDPGVAEYAVYVHQNSRGRGVGTEMNRVAVEVAATLALRRLWLSVEPGNRPAVRSYEKAGFRFLPGTILSLEAEMVVDLGV